MKCRKCKKEMVRKSCMCRDSAYPDLPDGKGVVWHCKGCDVAYLDSGRMSAPGRRKEGKLLVGDNNRVYRAYGKPYQFVIASEDLKPDQKEEG